MFYFLKGYNSYHYYLDSLGLLSGDVGCSGVNELSRVLADRSNLALGLQVGNGSSGQRSVDSKSITENTWGDHLHLWNLN